MSFPHDFDLRERNCMTRILFYTYVFERHKNLSQANCLLWTEKYITSQKSHFRGDQKLQFETDIRIIVRH